MPTIDAGTLREWSHENQRHLALRAAATQAMLEARRDDAIEPAELADRLGAEVRVRLGRPVALDRVCGLFGLTGFERDVLVAAAAPELGLDVPVGPLTFDRALRAFPDAHWSAVLPDGPLRAWRLVDLPPPSPLYPGPLRAPIGVDERVVHALLGADTLDERLLGRCRLLGAADAPVEEVASGVPDATRADAVRALVDRLRPEGEFGWVHVVGADAPSRRALAAAAALELELRLLLVVAADLPEEGPQLTAFGRLVAREAGLGGGMLLVEAEEETERRAIRLLDEAARFGVPCALSLPGVEPRPSGLVTVPMPTSGPMTGEKAAGAPSAGSTRASVFVLDGLATLRRPNLRLDELVLSETSERALHALLAHVRQRDRVHGEWGWDERGRGLAVTALFVGPSGTGKTTTAEAIAAELGLDVVAVDVSQVMSKYIGETQKNWAKLFERCESGAVMLVDEGEAILGARTKVRDSHDRYANLETSYLLQRLETFRGIAIVTTNARESLDPAFTRRMRFIVQFPFPDAGQRAELWRHAFPPGVPTEGLDTGRLAQLAVSGGTIAQVALQAAFLAADDGAPVEMRHLLEATRIECDKLERPLTSAEIRGWVA